MSGRKRNFPSSFLNSSGWSNNQIDMRQIKRENNQIYYLYTYKGLKNTSPEDESGS